jgi:hypothetical protein
MDNFMNGLHPASFYSIFNLDSNLGMFRKGIHLRILITALAVILAGLYVSANESSYACFSQICLIDQAQDMPDFAQPMISDDANGLRAQAGSFKTAFARRVYKSKIYRGISQRLTARSEFSCRQEFPARSICDSGAYVFFTRPYYYTFLFRLTPF